MNAKTLKNNEIPIFILSRSKQRPSAKQRSLPLGQTPRERNLIQSNPIGQTGSEIKQNRNRERNGIRVPSRGVGPLLAAGVVLLGAVGVAVGVGPGPAVQIGEGAYAAGPAAGGLGRFLVVRRHCPPPPSRRSLYGPIESACRRREREREREKETGRLF